MKKIKELWQEKMQSAIIVTYSIMCPACKQPHNFNSTWNFNKDFEKPTISPSLLVTGVDSNGKTICHSFVNNGKIQFLDDCSHSLKGQTVELLDNN